MVRLFVRSLEKGNRGAHGVYAMSFGDAEAVTSPCSCSGDAIDRMREVLFWLLSSELGFRSFLKEGDGESSGLLLELPHTTVRKVQLRLHV